MVTLEENELTTEEFTPDIEDEDVESKVASLKESLAQGEIPEDLKEFIASLQAMKNDDSADEVLDDESDDEELLDEEAEDEEDDEIESVDNMSAMEESDSSLDDLNSLF